MFMKISTTMIPQLCGTGKHFKGDFTLSTETKSRKNWRFSNATSGNKSSSPN